jgi:hypothetical protein
MIGVKRIYEGKFSTTPAEMYPEDYVGGQYMSSGPLPWNLIAVRFSGCSPIAIDDVADV